MYNIFKSFIYSFMRILMNASMSFSYRNIIVSGYDKIKDRRPVLFLGNHQNTFMDGLVLIHTAPHFSPKVLSRADIFKNKWAAIALDIIGSLPIYRKKDNMGGLEQNSETFKRCVDLFNQGKHLLIFPEGNHSLKRYLRPLKKGSARIALQTEEDNNFQLGLSVVPFGLYYENHPKRWYDLHMHFADGFTVSDFQQTYEESPSKAQRQFTDKVKEEISAEIVDIKWQSEYEFMEQVRVLLKPYALNWAENQKSIVHAESEIVNKIAGQLKGDEDKTDLLKEKTKVYFELLKRNKLSEDFTPRKPNILTLILKVIGVLIGLPFWLLAKVINFIPEYIIHKKIIAGVKDRAWHISLITGASLFLYPLYYFLVFIVLGLSFDWILSGIIVFTFPLISVIMYETEYHFKKLKNAFILFRKPGILKQEQELVKEYKALL